MRKFKATYDHKQLLSIFPVSTDETTSNEILEEHTGQTLFAIIEAESEAEAHEKARRLETELITRKTKQDFEKK